MCIRDRRERETETERQTETDTERDTETYRETDRETYRDRDRKTETERQRYYLIIKVKTTKTKQEDNDERVLQRRSKQISG